MENSLKREIIRVEPYSTWFETWKAPASLVSRAGNLIFVSGIPPFDPNTGKVKDGASVGEQTELIMNQLGKCLEAAGSDFDHILKCNVFSTSVDYFSEINAVYVRYFKE